MKTYAINLFLLLGLASGIVSHASAHEFSLEINHIKSIQGTVRVAIYNDQEAYKSHGKPTAHQQVAVTAESMTLNFGDLPEGSYAIRLYQDENDNGKLDFNVMGIPSEGYGYSNNGGAFGPVSFEDAKFELTAPTTLKIKMR